MVSNTFRAGASPLLHERVRLASEATPERTAIVMGAQSLTYGELERTSNRLAQLLIQQGVRFGDRVCLLLPKSPIAIVSMLATLKAGGVYVPIDISSPAARVQRIIASATPAGAISCEAGGKLLAELELGPTWLASVEGHLDGAAFTAADLPSQDERTPVGTGADDRAAHILFTSGSTGAPKGVLITHAMVTAFLDWAIPHFGHRPGDRISGHPPLHFDLSTFDVYGTLSSGGELHLPPPQTLLPQQLAAFIRSSELTQWFSVPSTFAYMARGDVIADRDFPSLRRVIWCGEVMAPAVLGHWMARVPQASYTNLYGPTETTIASSFYTVRVPPEDATVPIPIGQPCAGEEILVLDEQLRAVPAGQVGELCIAGSGVSPGYWQDAERTARAFLHDPISGRRLYRTGDLGRIDEDRCLHYVGRSDSQIKSRGYRIELGEVEAAIHAIPQVAEAAVVAVPTDGFEGTTICCAYSSTRVPAHERAELRGELAQTLPSYMLPTRWISLQELPRNASGKIDRPALKDIFLAGRHG